MKISINKYDSFKSWYKKIIREFHFEPEKDQRARDILFEIIKSKKRRWNVEEILKGFKGKVNEKNALLIYGCGPSLENSVEKIIAAQGKSIFSRFVNLAADGASIFLRERELPLDGIFTDLDGITEKEFTYGEYLIVHAHGDNIGKLNSFKKQIIEKRNVIATSQVEPKPGVFNPGGFTDGDRILYFIKNLITPTQTIYLIGMDFKETVGKYSKPYKKEDFTAPQIKRKKLEIAVKLIEQIIEDVENDIYFVNSPRVSDKFNYLTLTEFTTEHIPKN